MDDLIEPHDPLPDCDCKNCACRERDRLREALKQANASAEHFEREWYLRGDALENLEIQAVRDVAPGWVSIPAVEWDSIMTPNYN